MRATITTDASVCSMYKVGGYAFWISADNGRFKGYGGFKRDVKGSTSAEFKAIVNAIHYYLRKPESDGVRELIVNTDSEQVIRIMDLKKSKLKSNNVNTVCALMIHDMMHKHNLNIEFRKVKAHTDGNTARTYVNNWCDKFAKKAMRKRRKKYQKK